jgi:mRNA degradation ribonuclease J1/J2
MIGSPSDKKAVVIDPTCEIDNNAISTLVNKNDLKIVALIDTHMHTDHLSGATRVAQKYGCEVYVSSLEPYEINNSLSNNYISFYYKIDGITRISKIKTITRTKKTCYSSFLNFVQSLFVLIYCIWPFSICDSFTICCYVVAGRNISCSVEHSWSRPAYLNKLLSRWSWMKIDCYIDYS